jgi:transcriptional regulator with XRE-family HTH domain
LTQLFVKTGSPAKVFVEGVGGKLPLASLAGHSICEKRDRAWAFRESQARMKIGTTIRGYRLQKGLSQGDIEKRTGLLRCYLSRVENGHTVPSLDTLAKIAQALDLPLAQFFAEDSLGREMNTQKLTDEELRFLTQIRRYSSNLNESDRKLLLAMVKKFAATAVR